MSEDTAADKRALRQRIRAARRVRAADPAATALTDEAIGGLATALALDTGARTIAAYLSSAEEPGTRTLLRTTGGAGLRILLPLAQDGGVLDWVDSAGAGERRHPLGMPEATGSPLGPDALATADLVLAPAAAADLDGNRLGWGRGYYDRALARLEHRPPVFVLLHDDELLEQVPHEPHDERVDGVVTPTRIVRFARSRH